MNAPPSVAHFGPRSWPDVAVLRWALFLFGEVDPNVPPLPRDVDRRPGLTAARDFLDPAQGVHIRLGEPRQARELSAQTDEFAIFFLAFSSSSGAARLRRP
jgi:hypothetical protein